MAEIQRSESRSGAQHPPEPMTGVSLEHDLSAQIELLRGEDAYRHGRNSKTLVKHPDFRIVLTAMRSGARIHEHKSAGRISVQTLAGHIRIQIPGSIADLTAGHLLTLDREVPHDVEALEDSAFLLTIAFPS